MNIQPKKGFVIVDKHGVMDLKTLYPTERGTKVNALVVIESVRVTSSWDEDKINNEFDNLIYRQGYRIVPILVTAESSENESGTGTSNIS